MQQSGATVLQSKQHFHILDGLRGVAALGVVIFHFMEMVFTDYSKNFIGHGFLAVDFFFCLSGFVIAYAYDDRITKMGVKAFFISRLIRLQPLVIAGSILGLLAFLFDPFATYQSTYGVGRTSLIFLMSFLLIPFPVMAERYFNLFGLNAPAWSLFWEYIANIFYGFVLYNIARRWLVLLTFFSGILLCVVCYRSGNIMGGWGKDTFWDGGARVCYSFLAGLLVYRSGWMIKSKLGFGVLSILLFLAFMMPWTNKNWLIEALVVLFYFPFLIALGAGAKLSTAMKSICIFSGKISYPLYMTHYAAIWIFSNYYNSHPHTTTQLTLIVITGVIALIGFAYLFMVAYDTPVRKYLTGKRKQ
jgi:peptidoglycan/LPS O-acetylase OafA/YrhL